MISLGIASYLIPPESVLVKGSKAVDNDRKRKGEYEAAHESTQAPKHLAKIGLYKI